MSNEIVIVGAGVAGLACAQRLSAAGQDVVVLEKSHGLGGRCATRRIEGQPVDHGVCFYHGSDPEFLEALDSVPAKRFDGWPRRIRGTGRPCQPRSLATNERRLAFAEGVTAFPKHLAHGLRVKREARVTGVIPRGDRFLIRSSDGSEIDTTILVLALPTAQASDLLESCVEGERVLAGTVQLLRMLGNAPCLTTIAGYEDLEPKPEWEMFYPEDSKILQLISHDSSKREAPAQVVLVLQALPGWSRKHWDDPTDRWREEMLTEAARLAGDRVASPSWTQTQRWRHGRSTGADELSRPVWITTTGGARLGVIGEAMAPGGGVQAAWRSGNLLAEEIL